MFIRSIPLIAATVLLFPLLSDLAAAEPRDPAVFEPEIRKFEVEDRRTPPARRATLFVGSSSVRMWTNLSTAFPGETTLNRGFGGSTMKDLLFYFDRIVLPYRPGVVVVYEGDNDLAQGRAPDLVAGDYVDFLDRMERQLPGTPVVLIAVKPSPSRRTLLESQRDLNARLKSFAKHRPNVSFADTFTPILDARGEPDPRFFHADMLHLNPDGYAEWQPVIGRALRERSKAQAPR